jgi:hypothetical protein
MRIAILFEVPDEKFANTALLVGKVHDDLECRFPDMKDFSLIHYEDRNNMLVRAAFDVIRESS